MRPHLVSTHPSLSTTWVTTRSSETRMGVSGELSSVCPLRILYTLLLPDMDQYTRPITSCLGRSFARSPKRNKRPSARLTHRYPFIAYHLIVIVGHQRRYLLDKTKKNIPFHKAYDVRYVRRPRSHPRLTSCKCSYFSPRSCVLNGLLYFAAQFFLTINSPGLAHFYFE